MGGGYIWLEEREPFPVQETAIRITLLGSTADEEEEEMEMAGGNGLRRYRVVGAPNSSPVGKNYPNMLQVCYWVGRFSGVLKREKENFQKKKLAAANALRVSV